VLDIFNAHNANNQVHGVAAQLMSHDQFMANHAPTQVQAQTVANYLASMGYKNIVIAPNRMLVSADGTAATASKAFLTSMAQVKTHDGRIAYANTSDVQIPAPLTDSILAVTGLQTVHIAHTFVRRNSSSGAHTDAITGHNPVEFSSIYSATGVPTAAGVTVGIFTSGDVAPAISDLNIFTANNKLATVTTQVVTTNGGSSDTNGTDEWDLDSQDIVGMGGGEVGQIIFYTTASLTNSDMLANFNTIVNANAAKIVNVSIGGCELDALPDGTAVATDQILSVGVAQGQTFSISTGDSGADECGNGGTTPSWPANSPYAVAAAGTTLDASTTTWAGETVWAGSGGSPSTYELKPIWQYALVPGNFRGVADIAFDADPSSGAVIVFHGSMAPFGGTSLSAPLFAGMWARVLAVKGTGFGFAAPLIYALPQSDFHDITVGSNGGETAGVGYDFASGRGSIILNTAINHLGVPIGSAPVPNFSYVAHGLKVAFTDHSTDSDGTVVSHYWNFGDSQALVNAKNPTHTYLGAGTYNVSENVFDNSGNLRTKSVALAVAPGGLIANTGFETGAAPWIMSKGVLNHGGAEPSHGGQWDAWMGGKGQANNETISQQVKLPATKSSANLTFWLHVDSNEVTQTRKFDRLTVGVYSTGGALLGTLATFSNLDKAPGYVVHNADMSHWIGQTVVLKFTSNEDSSLQTSFVLDDVTLFAQ
jgi:subtilase family serine protease